MIAIRSIVLTGFVGLIAVPASAQGEGGSPRTQWGDPDLRGVWSYASLTPLQRPASMGEREHYTPEEAAERNESVLRERPAQPGNVGSYNIHWFDRGQVSEDLRTSLIVDPPEWQASVHGGRTGAAGDAAYVPRGPSRGLMARSDELGPVHHLPRRAPAVDWLQQHVPHRAD